MRFIKFKRLFLLAIVSVLVNPASGLEIVINQGQATAQPIIIVPFVDDAGFSKLSVARVVGSDLSLSGKFKPLGENLLPSLPGSSEGLNFSNWNRLGASFMVVGNITAGKLQVELLDIHNQDRLAKYSVNLTGGEGKYMRKIAHKISDLIYKKLTGNKGAFSTRLAYVSVRMNNAGNKSYALEISGVDGKDAVVAFRSSKSIFSPSWSPDAKKISFVSLENDKTQVWQIDLISRERIKLADFAGNNSAPSWSPDGTKLALSLSRDGNPEVYIMHPGGQLQRFTRHNSADTEPVWAPDGNSIYFLSDREGGPQIFNKSLNDGSLKKVSTFGKYNASPDISVDGKKLVLLHKTELGYQIAVQDLSAASLTVVSKSTTDESPSFSPNGDMIVYASKDSGRGVLTVTDVGGTVHRVYSSSVKDVREPAWSPYLD